MKMVKGFLWVSMWVGEYSHLIFSFYHNYNGILMFNFIKHSNISFYETNLKENQKTQILHCLPGQNELYLKLYSLVIFISPAFKNF